MNNRVLPPRQEHKCAPNWKVADDGVHMVGTGLEWSTDGTIFECECGKLLVAYHPRYANAVVLTCSWRPAGWRERRRFRRATS